MASFENPFPGMNPYLERRWGDVHHRLINLAADSIQDRLPDDLRARMDERVFIETEPRHIARPDVFVFEHGNVRRGGAEESGEALGLAVIDSSEPMVIHVPSFEATEVFLNIIDARSGGKVITSLEILSHSNKTPGQGRELYLRKQSDCQDAGVNLVEIDLIRGGAPVTLIPPHLIPPERRSPYHVCVYRAAKPDRLEVYSAPLRQHLPIIRLPLRPGDPDVTLDLQSLVNEAQRKGRYDEIDYAESLDPPLSPDDAAWAAQLVG